LPITEPMTIEFPQGAYVEYAFLDVNKQPIADLANIHVPRNPWYDYHRSITLPENHFQIPLRPLTFRGNISEHTINSQEFASQRTYYVYEPVITPLTTVYVQDGEA